jgi:hypothetical protein
MERNKHVLSCLWWWEGRRDHQESKEQDTWLEIIYTETKWGRMRRKGRRSRDKDWIKSTWKDRLIVNDYFLVSHHQRIFLLSLSLPQNSTCFSSCIFVSNFLSRQTHASRMSCFILHVNVWQPRGRQREYYEDIDFSDDDANYCETNLIIYELTMLSQERDSCWDRMRTKRVFPCMIRDDIVSAFGTLVSLTLISD